LLGCSTFLLVQESSKEHTLSIARVSRRVLKTKDKAILLSFACTKESKQRKVHPSFTAIPRSLAIFLTKIFELATLKQTKIS